MKSYQFFALISMFFAGITSVIAKLGLKNVGSDTGLAVRTSFVFIFIWANIFLFNSLKEFKSLTKNDVLFLAGSAVTTTLSWVFYYKAIKIGSVSEVALIDKSSIIITLIFSTIFLHEQITVKTILGTLLIVSGLITLMSK